MTNSRNKGAAFERQIAAMLHDELGITFERDLDQYRKSDRGDLITSEPFPFLIECKKTARILTACDPAWWQQAERAALVARKSPCVIWASDRRQIRVTMRVRDAMECISGGRWSAQNMLIETTFECFCYIAREGLYSNPQNWTLEAIRP